MNDFTYQFIPGTGDRTLLLLHGTGGNENDLLPLGRAIDPDAALLSPRGKVLENGAPFTSAGDHVRKLCRPDLRRAVRSNCYATADQRAGRIVARPKRRS